MTHKIHSKDIADPKITDQLKKKGFKVRLWDGDFFGEDALIQTSSPTGRTILQAFERAPVDEYILMELSRKNVLKEIQLDQEIDLSSDGPEKFFAFRSDRVYKVSINDKRYSWGDDSISEGLLRIIGQIKDTHELVLEMSEEADRVLGQNESVDLSNSNVEHIYSRPKEWKLNVQGVLLTLTTNKIIVRDALVQAGFDLNECWTAILKVKGQPKRPVELDSVIDLTEPGIEKLRLRPNEIKNGETLNTLRRDFCLLDKDEAYLEKRNLLWETVIEGRRRWLILRSFETPVGYNKEAIDMAMDVPDTYPAAAMDMFYCFPSLTIGNDRKPDRTDSMLDIEGKKYQQWSRHLNGATRWNPQTDSVISHIAFIEDSLGNEVEL